MCDTGLQNGAWEFTQDGQGPLHFPAVFVAQIQLWNVQIQLIKDLMAATLAS